MRIKVTAKAVSWERDKSVCQEQRLVWCSSSLLVAARARLYPAILPAEQNTIMDHKYTAIAGEEYNEENNYN